jgi:hypothetical protein
VATAVINERRMNRFSCYAGSACSTNLCAIIR